MIDGVRLKKRERPPRSWAEVGRHAHPIINLSPFPSFPQMNDLIQPQQQLDALTNDLENAQSELLPAPTLGSEVTNDQANDVEQTLMADSGIEGPT